MTTTTDAIRDLVLSAARGSYQEGLLTGYETWSGSSLAGKAGEWGSKYHRSRVNLLARINAALPDGWRAETRLLLLGSPRRWRRELVIVAPGGEATPWSDCHPCLGPVASR